MFHDFSSLCSIRLKAQSNKANMAVDSYGVFTQKAKQKSQLDHFLNFFSFFGLLARVFIHPKQP